MIYISTSCVKETSKISDAIITLASNGIKNIELSGGTEYYNDLTADLIQLKDEHEISYLVHNYFPPPKNHFVLNLASLDDHIYNSTLDHFKTSLELSELLGAKRFALHAGFLLDPKVDELGRKISKDNLYNREESLIRFGKGLEILKRHTDNVKIHIENNVYSYSNSLNFPENPFLFTSHETYLELRNIVDFDVLLDLAHLKVSCDTLALDFNSELEKLISITDYLHMSDNDGRSDSNKSFTNNSNIYKSLISHNLKDKIITLEIYEPLSKVLQSYQIMRELT